jgi:hypothetical protein
VENKYEVGCTPFFSLLCPWRLDGLLAGQPGSDSRQGQIFLFSTMFRPVLGPSQPPIQWLPVALSSGLKRSRRLNVLRAGRPGLNSWQEQDVSLLHNVQSGSGAHQASYPMSTGGSFSGGKTVGAWNWDKTGILIAPVSVASRRATVWTAGVGFPTGARCFSSPQRPDRFWGPPSILPSEYRGLFLWG